MPAVIISKEKHPRGQKDSWHNKFQQVMAGLAKRNMMRTTYGILNTLVAISKRLKMCMIDFNNFAKPQISKLIWNT